MHRYNQDILLLLSISFGNVEDLSNMFFLGGTNHFQADLTLEGCKANRGDADRLIRRRSFINHDCSGTVWGGAIETPPPSEMVQVASAFDTFCD